MPPRYAYWTIIAGGLPTAFRTTEREELLPTFRRIKQKHPDAEMKYFARGRLWRSQEEARLEAEARRAAAAERQSAPRGRDWRPGGGHHDPRQKFKNAKKARNQKWRKDRFDRRHRSGAAQPPGETPVRPAPPAPRTEWRDRGPRTAKLAAAGHKPRRDRGPRGGKPRAERKLEGRGKPEARGDRPWRDRLPQDNRRGEPSRREPKAGDDRRPAGPRPKGPHGSPKASWGRKPAPRPRSSGPWNRPAGPPDRGRHQRGPAKDPRRR